MQHSEYFNLSTDGLVNEGIVSIKLGLQGIPDLSEKIIYERDLNLIEDLKCRYQFTKFTSSISLELGIGEEK